MSINVRSEVQVYEIDGLEASPVTEPKLEVSSHWNRHQFVVLKYTDGPAITVYAADLEAAIRNATNTGSR